MHRIKWTTAKKQELQTFDRFALEIDHMHNNGLYENLSSRATTDASFNLSVLIVMGLELLRGKRKCIIYIQNFVGYTIIAIFAGAVLS